MSTNGKVKRGNHGRHSNDGDSEAKEQSNSLSLLMMIIGILERQKGRCCVDVMQDMSIHALKTSYCHSRTRPQQIARYHSIIALLYLP
jgi:hypothetical protein